MFYATKADAREKLAALAEELEAKALEAADRLALAEQEHEGLLADARSCPGTDLGEEAAQRLLQLSAGADSPEDPSVQVLGTVAGFLAHADRLFPAEELYQRYLDVYMAAFPEQLVLVGPMRSLATVMKRQGRHSEAERVFRRALALQESHLGLKHPEVAATLFSLGDTLRAQGKYEECEPFFKRSQSIRDRMGAQADTMPDCEAFW